MRLRCSMSFVWNKFMKKLLVAVCLMAAFKAQAQFIEKVDFVGALSADASQDWTKGWAEWDPKSKSYADATDLTTLNDATGKKEISTALTLDASKVYALNSLVVVRAGGKLTIPAGTLIRAKADLNATPKLYSTIVVERGGIIEINGTSSNPVVITSANAVGSRERGDWGGIVICGKAINNQGNEIQVEGFNNISFDATLAKFGGTEDNDNSGVVKYVRIEFGGLAFEPNKEINGLTMGSVGVNTTVEGVQVSYGGDDAFEWFGGTVNCKKLIAYKGTDDDFDTDFGYRGAVQFGIAARDTNYFDLSWNAPSGSSTSETFESDNDAGGSGKTPYTAAVFSNITCMGPVPLGSSYSAMSSTIKGAFRRGARIRRNSRLSIINSVFMGYRNFIMFDGDSVLVAAGVKPSGSISDAGNLIRNNYIANTSAAATAGATNTGLVEVDTKNTPAGLDAWLRDAKNANKIDAAAFTSGSILVDPQNATAPDFRPVSTSGVVGMADFTATLLSKYGVFDHVATVGAVRVTNAYPVPASNEVNVEVYALSHMETQVSVLNMSGAIVKSAGFQNLNEGGNLISVSVGDLVNGIYFLKIAGNQGTLTYRFVINK